VSEPLTLETLTRALEEFNAQIDDSALDIDLNFRPLRDNIVVLPAIPTDRVLKSGVIAPKQGYDKPEWGLVFAVGPNAVEVNPGDWVCFPRLHETTFAFLGREWFIFRECNILAVIQEDKPDVSD